MPDFLKDNQATDKVQEPITQPADLDVQIEKSDIQIQSGYPGLLIDGTFWHWREKLTEPSIALRKIRDKVNKAINVFTSVLVLAAIAVSVLNIVLVEPALALEADFWFGTNFTMLSLWFAVLCLLFLFFRVQDKKMKQKKIPVLKGEKVNEVQTIPSLEATQKKVDIGLVMTKEAREAVENAYHVARKGGVAEVMPLHIFVGTLSSQPVATLFMRLGISFDQIKDAVRRRLTTYEKGNTVFGVKAQEIIAGAMRNSYLYKRPYLGTIEMFVEAYNADEFIQELLYSLEIEKKELENAAMWIRINEQLVDRYQEFRKAASLKPTSNMNRAYTAVATPFLDRVSQDLTKYAVYGRLPMLIGRDKEMNNILRAIEGGNKSVVLVGEPGVGKSAIIAGIAEKMVEESVPEILQDKRLVKISIPHIVSSEGGDGAQERLLAALQEIGRSGNIVTVIENIDQLVGRAGGVDLASVLSSELEKGYTFVIATTTPQGYTGVIERSVLGQKLEKIVLNEPERDDAIQVLESKIGGIENKNKVVFTYEAVAAIIDFSSRYMREAMLPEKAIVLAEEVANSVGRRGKQWARVSKEDVAGIISEKTNVPITQVGQEEGEKLLHLEDRMHERIIGQEEAVKAVAASLRRARVELRSQDRPIANFLFLGPTGVGKTETARALAGFLFNDENALIRLDMSEYMEKYSVSKMIGSPPGYVGYEEGGQLTEKIRRRPYAVVLLDEIEKAHPEVFNILLQILEDGRLTDAKGRVASFQNAILIMTSNVGSEYIAQMGQIGFTAEKEKAQRESLKEKVLEALKEQFRPEFLNRIDEIIIFNYLGKPEIRKIVELELKKVKDRLEDKKIKIDFSNATKELLVERGFDPNLGARPLKRVIQKLILDPLSLKIVSGLTKEGDNVFVDLEAGKIIFKTPKGSIRVVKEREKVSV